MRLLDNPIDDESEGEEPTDEGRERDERVYGMPPFKGATSG
jgi:hypothetical protein